MGQKRTNHRWLKSTFVRYAPNSGQILQRSEMTLSATRDRCTAAISISLFDYVDVSGARHMVAGDRNDHFSAAVLSFIERRNVAGNRQAQRTVRTKIKSFRRP